MVLCSNQIKSPYFSSYMKLKKLISVNCSLFLFISGPLLIFFFLLFYLLLYLLVFMQSSCFSLVGFCIWEIGLPLCLIAPPNITFPVWIDRSTYTIHLLLFIEVFVNEDITITKSSVSISKFIFLQLICSMFHMRFFKLQNHFLWCESFSVDLLSTR